MDLKSPDVDAKGEGRRATYAAGDNRALKPSPKAMEKLNEQAVKCVYNTLHLVNNIVNNTYNAAIEDELYSVRCACVV